MPIRCLACDSKISEYSKDLDFCSKCSTISKEVFSDYDTIISGDGDDGPDKYLPADEMAFSKKNGQ